MLKSEGYGCSNLPLNGKHLLILFLIIPQHSFNKFQLYAHIKITI